MELESENPLKKLGVTVKSIENPFEYKKSSEVNNKRIIFLAILPSVIDKMGIGAHTDDVISEAVRLTHRAYQEYIKL